MFHGLPPMNVCNVQGVSTVLVIYRSLLTTPPLRVQAWQSRTSYIYSLKQLLQTTKSDLMVVLGNYNAVTGTNRLQSDTDGTLGRWLS